MPENDRPSANTIEAPRQLTPAAARALEEAAGRRRQRDIEANDKAETADRAENRPKEIGGRMGPDPVRYGDWENGGIASDF